MEWNAENQLTRVAKNTIEQARFKYDPLGRRAEKVARGGTTTYVYNEDDLLREQTNTGTSVKYIHTDLIDEPMAKEDSTGALTYFQLDGLSSVIKTTDAAGAVIGSYLYGGFGSLQQGTPGPFGFTSREPDAETGLVYMRARYYDPGVGRFLSEDPAGFTGTLNLYSYVDSSPTNYTDPLGLFKTAGCSTQQISAIENAVTEAQQKLNGGCACSGGGASGGNGPSGGGSGGQGQKLSKIIGSAKYICKPTLKDCGKAPYRPGPNRIYLGPDAFKPERCGPLPCTFIHEATHRTQWIFTKKKEEKAQEMEKQCCGL